MNKTYHDLVVLLSRGISQRRMYFEGHPRVHDCAREFTENLARLQREDAKGEFFIGVANGKLVHEGKYLIGPSIIGSRLNHFAALLGSGGFLFHHGITTGELLNFFSLGAAQSTKISTLAEAKKLLKSKGIIKIELSPPFEDAGWFGQLQPDEHEVANMLRDEEWEELLPTFQSLYATVETAHESGQIGRSLDIEDVQETSERLVKATGGPVSDIMQLVKYPDYDSYTVGHSVRVAMFAVMVGQHLELPEHVLNELGVASLMHDVGKSRIPSEILYKPGRLDDAERTIMEEHPALGAEMLLESNVESEMAITTAWGHHRRYDRKGYPEMPFGSRESSVTQIINVCDVFEALTAIRPYKKAHTARKSFEMMMADPGWFCPGALAAFCGAIGLYPAGSVVLLTSGHRAQVLGPGELFDRPRVKLTHCPKGLDLPEEDQVEINLSTQSNQVGVQEQRVFV
jgi:HD-GYP domain-containing protein (c-di-GMP phosphodiesterase class II)